MQLALLVLLVHLDYKDLILIYMTFNNNDFDFFQKYIDTKKNTNKNNSVTIDSKNNSYDNIRKIVIENNEKTNRSKTTINDVKPKSKTSKSTLNNVKLKIKDIGL